MNPKLLPNTTEIEAKIAKVMAANEAEIETIRKRLAEATREIRVQYDKMEAATSGLDSSTYHDANDARLKAVEEKEMLTTRLDLLKSPHLPIISENDYQSAVKAIQDEMDALDKKTQARLAELAEEASELAESLLEAGAYANKVLEKLQHDLYRDADRRKAKDGTCLGYLDKKNCGSFGDTVEWGNTLIRHYKYEKSTGKKPQLTTEHRIWIG